MGLGTIRDENVLIKIKFPFYCRETVVNYNDGQPFVPYITFAKGKADKKSEKIREDAFQLLVVRNPKSAYHLI